MAVSAFSISINFAFVRYNHPATSAPARYTPPERASFHDFYRDLLPSIKTRRAQPKLAGKDDFRRGFVENIRPVSHN